MNDKTPAATAPADEKPLKSYRVKLYIWNIHELFVDAPSEEDAEAQARRTLDVYGPEAFAWHSSGDEGFLVEERE
ncbi:hypothetical protein [Bradyrhizobium sp. CCGUVB23]|uniref:hypothetical protein n=1 Tax=Bradyrhizobium sp. CCGUVB23 TaxID=2949630 RepID=UPI0020B1EF81|nr:hypothetical protein [Bradyrhizobium sp. CCGUVB23]MCP3463071.1 hypothetical protein [Bradyrhizobium sp. CCGUVB23]